MGLPQVLPEGGLEFHGRPLLVDELRKAVEHFEGEPHQLRADPRAGQRQHAKDHHQLGGKGERLLLDLGGRLEDRDQEPTIMLMTMGGAER